jgi:hypothetical protein
MRFLRNHRQSIALAAVAAGVLAMPVVASAQSRIYPSGTDCASQPTIAERLLCGQQEQRRQQGVSVEEPVVNPETPGPFPDRPASVEFRPAPGQQELVPSSASTRH